MDWNDKKILVTGSSGFIGSHLTDKLLELGADVTTVDVKQPKNLPANINFLECDITDPNSINKVIKDKEFVFHLAAIANPRTCEEDPNLAFRMNVQGTFNVLQSSLNNKVKKVVFSSAAALYGRYPQYIPMDEKHPIEPFQTVYLATKRACELFCDFFQEKYKLPLIYFRLVTVYGPRQIPEFFIPTVITKALKSDVFDLWNSKPTRDFVYVADVVDALIKGAESDYVNGPLNIGSGREIQVGELAKIIINHIEQLQNRKIEVKYLEKDVIGPMRLLCDNRKIKEVLGWEPKVSLEDGIKETIKWYVENKDYST